MRGILLGMAGLLIGALGALGYSHYLGDGKLLEEARAELATARADLAKAADETQHAKSETVSKSSQIEQLAAAKNDLKKQLDQAQSSAPEKPASTNPFANPAMAGMIKARFAQERQNRLDMLKARLRRAMMHQFKPPGQ